jgi:hypothetical protein
MPDFEFHLPGFEHRLAGPEAYVSGVLRNFGAASQALGRAVDRLVVRLATPSNGGNPDYQIETVDGEDAAAFSGQAHGFLFDDITVLVEEDRLQDEVYTAEQVKDWLNAINGEGAGGGTIDPILTDRWTEGDTGDPRE